MTYQWKQFPPVLDNPLRTYILEMNEGLRLEVRQTQARSEFADREYSFMLFRTINGMQSCLWHKDKVPEIPNKDICGIALSCIQKHFDDEIARLEKIRESLSYAAVT